MNSSPPRVAFFTDTYDEINGVALTSRQLAAFARRRGYPFLCVRGENGTRGEEDVRGGSGGNRGDGARRGDGVREDDSFREVVGGRGGDTAGDATVLLPRGGWSVSLDRGLLYDPLLWRHFARVRSAIRRFRPDVIHLVSPGDVSQLGMAAAFLEKIPLAISWHTNLHEFGERRLRSLLQSFPGAVRDRMCGLSERAMLGIFAAFYRAGRVLYAPNQELIDLLSQRTGRPTLAMTRGVDTELFHPSKRRVRDSIFRIGFVGRLTPEKNVRVLADIERGLLERGLRDFRLVIVGDGCERRWLCRNLQHAELPGILRGEELAAAYADMDVFLFPSRTDTFGNVVQEAMASGAPPIVTDKGGPKFIVCDGVSGFVTRSAEEMAERTAELMRDRERLASMRLAGLEQVSYASWERVFEQVYAGYSTAMARQGPYRDLARARLAGQLQPPGA